MSYAPNYTPTTDFSQDEANNVSGRSTARTANIDAELNNISTSINALNNNIKLLQRSDGEVKDGIIKMNSLSLAVKAALGNNPDSAELLEETLSETQTLRDEAEGFSESASTSETNASNSADNAATSEANADASEAVALAAKVAAEAARDIAQLSSGIYETIGAGITATTNGQYFSVPQSSPSDIMFDLYKNNSGVALYINSYSSSSLVKYSAQTNYQYAFVDADGFIIAYIDDGTFKTVTNTVRTGLLDAGTFIMQYLSDGVSQALTLKDVDGFIFATLSALGRLKSTAFTLDSGLLDVSTWSIAYNTVRDGYLLVDQDGFILMSLDATDGIQAVGLTSDETVLSPLSRAKRVLTLGDSRTEQNSVSPNTAERMTRLADYGYMAWAIYFARGNISYVYNAGISGNTTAQMLSRFNTDVLPYEIDEIWGEGGINDLQASVSESVTKANLAAIFDLCDANGIYIRWSTITPLETGQTYFTPDNVAKICNINQWLKEQSLIRKNMTLVDTFSAMIDKLSTTGTAASGMLQTDDHIHQAPKGAKAQGYAFAQSFVNDNNLIDFLPICAAQRYSLSSDFKQLFDNPLFIDTGGTNNSSGVVTGTIPANSRVSVSGTWGIGLITSALVARADGIGYDWVLTVANAGAENDTLTLAFDDVSSRITNDDVVYAVAELTLENLAKSRGHKFEINTTVNSVFKRASTFEYSDYQPTGITPNPNNAWTDDMYNQSNISGVLKTPELTIASSGTITNTQPVFVFRFGGVGSTAVIKIGRLGVYKL
jgi:lysophospholipase L1-like esterase